MQELVEAGMGHREALSQAIRDFPLEPPGFYARKGGETFVAGRLPPSDDETAVGGDTTDG